MSKHKPFKLGLPDNRSPDELFLDLKNPRFGLTEATTQEEALKILFLNADLKELWNSILENGFQPYEPLVAVEEDNKLVVLEGNRRLAAVKILRDPTLLPEAIKRISSPIPENILRTMDFLSVHIVPERSNADAFIGFKHVNGPNRWSPLAKAKFAVQFFEAMDGTLDEKERLQSLTHQLGDSRQLIIRQLVAYKIIEQARRLSIFEDNNINVEDIEFSHLYTLINNGASRDFLGLSRAPLKENLINNAPVPDTHLRELEEIVKWLYGEERVIRSQGTDRPTLQKVLASAEGIEELRRTGDLATAATIAGLNTEDWMKDLAKTYGLSKHLYSEAISVVGELDSEEIGRAERNIEQITKFMTQIKGQLKYSEKS